VERRQLITRTISNDNYAYAPVASIDQGYIANGLNQYSAVARTLSR
jgi:disulfide oxidoreductase YuzD